MGGSHQALFDLVRNLDRSRFEAVVLFYEDNRFATLLREQGFETHTFDEVRARERRLQRTGSWVAKRIGVVKTILQRRRFLLEHRNQVELRILAHYSGDDSLVDAFEKGEDIHRRTAAEVAGIGVEEVSDDQRAAAKAVNCGIIYGSSAFGLANNLGIATGEAQEIVDAYFARYQGVRRFLDETVADAKERGHVCTLLGRRRYLPDLRSKNRVLRQAAERMAVNTVIQGTAADLIKKAMVEVDEALSASPLHARMILQVHDELVFELPSKEADEVGQLVRECMEGVFSLRVPLVVDVGVGKTWREAH